MSARNLQFTTDASAVGPVSRLLLSPGTSLTLPQDGSVDLSEKAAGVKLSQLLTERIIEKIKESSGGDLFTIRIDPIIDNFGALAQIRIIRIEKNDRESNSTPGSNSILSEKSFGALLLDPIIARGRAGKRPQPISLKLILDGELVSATLTLFVGIRQSAWTL